jgi:hypothetical protein
LDVIVIGGGPAGLMAAGQAAALGARTLLIEKMDQPGRKLLITGKGRCNLTNTAPLDEFISHFGSNGRFLHSAFHHFFTTELIDFLAEIGVPTVTERGGRVFPASSDAGEVVERLTDWLRRQEVRVWTGARVERLLVEEQNIAGVQISSGHRHLAPSAIVATGGASYPGTGSTGDGYRLAQAVGHTIVPIRPALVPLDTAGNTAARLEGLSLRNVCASLWLDGKQAASEFGEMLFTRLGVSGPIVLTLSGRAVDALHAGQRVHLSIDLKPALDDQQLDARLLRDLDAYGKRQFHTLLKNLLPHTLIAVCCDLTGIPAEKLAHQITAQERKRLRLWLKDFRLEVIGHRPLAAAIITAGGIDLREVNPRTLESRLVAGLYFAGEVLDLNADTGGYNLQAAFSTGWLAGRSAARP